MFAIFIAVIALIICCILLCVVKRLYDRIKALEKEADEAETFSERGTRRICNQIMEDYMENTTNQIKRVDDVVKIFDERRTALDDQMTYARLMADTMVDAFKHRLSEAEQERRRKDDRNE